MQKISSYLYPNRIELLADLVGFTTEYTNVYQRTVKIYKGVDNVLEFDIKNADQKRIELNTSPSITSIELNVMDAGGKALQNSPYTVTPSSIKGIASATIPLADLNDLDHQFLTYSVTATKGTNTIALYADSRFGAVGKIELVGTAMPSTRPSKTFNTWSNEIDYSGNVLHHSNTIPAKFYEAEPTTSLTFAVLIKQGFIGTVKLESTTDMTISQSSWVDAKKYSTVTIFDNSHSNIGTVADSTITVTQTVGSTNYFRVTWNWPLNTSPQYGVTYSGFSTDQGPGSVASVTVS